MNSTIEHGGTNLIEKYFGEQTAPAGFESDFAAKSLPEQLRFLNNRYQELDVSIDPNTQALRCYMKPNGPPSFTPSMVRELIVLHRSIQGLFASLPLGAPPPFQYYVQGSRIPGIYNLGGDLAFLIDRITAGDREAIKRYAYDCVDAVYHIATGFGAPVVTIGLIQGNALGGGLEGALCCNVLIAERSVKMGFPEILFNSFPGMGAYSFVSRRLDAARAERMIFSGKVYTAQDMYDMGLVDLVVEDGEGEAAIRDYILNDRRSHAVRHAIYKMRQRVNPITLSELRDVTDMWVETAMQLDASDLRRMEHLQLAQVRRQAKARAPQA